MPQTLCSLGGVTFPYNPTVNKKDTPRSITYQEAISGGYFTDWGTVVQDITFEFEWPTMDSTFYNSLYSLYIATSVQYTFVDANSVSWTVVILNLSLASLLLGGADALENVVMKLGVVSKP